MNPCEESKSQFFGYANRLGQWLRGVLVIGIVAAWVAALPSVAAAARGKLPSYEPSAILPPKPLREFRGAWIPTIANIDWPSRKGLTTVEQKAELLLLLDRASQLKLNTIIFQVRPACDALYLSNIEPWSEYLTGTMGKAPQPFYDPLAFAVGEAHKRGLELHAWFNPYRARNSLAGSVAVSHVSKSRPHLVRRYGDQLWLDPGEQEVQDYSLAVVMDVVRRYDIDGVHFDDYFYPYQKDPSGKDLQFPDYPSWKRFGAGGRLTREDWRRENINGFVRRTYESIKATKPWVKFGISPFGIWRPDNPPQIKGLDPYRRHYADSRKWLANGWVDYLAPQLYWAIDSPEQAFPVLLKWWSEQNIKGRNLVAGVDATKTNNKWVAQEIVNQIRLTRQQKGITGHIHWDMRTLTRNSALASVLEGDVYLQPALAPASPWLGSTRAGKPRIGVEGGSWRVDKGKLVVAENQLALKARWDVNGTENPWLWLLQTQTGGEWRTEVLPGAQTLRLWTSRQPEVIAVTAVDRNGNTGLPVVVELKMR